MQFSFCIITSNVNDNTKNLIESIKRCVPPDCRDIVIVGGENGYDAEVRHIPFDESVKSGWITKKKNLAVANAKYENVVVMHDYIILDDNWYSGFLKYGNNFTVCSNIVLNKDGTRFRDWHLKDPQWRPGPLPQLQRRRLLPYDFKHCNLHTNMFINGGYWVSKKHIMTHIPLNEGLSWNEGEDIEWSNRITQSYPLCFNPHSTCHLQKQKDVIFEKVTGEDMNLIKNHLGTDTRVNLFLNVYKSSEGSQRQAELDFCLLNNLNNKHITDFYILDETGEIKDTERIHTIPTDKRYTYKDYLKLIESKTGDNDINIFMNSDCCLDANSSQYLHHIKSNEAWCLARWDITSINPFHANPYLVSNSQDAWILRGKPRELLDASYYLGVPGCDNRIMWEFQKAGYVIKNPSLSLKMFHYHHYNNGNRHYKFGSVIDLNRYGVCNPHHL
jgi:hypothetical protein